MIRPDPTELSGIRFYNDVPPGVLFVILDPSGCSSPLYEKGKTGTCLAYTFHFKDGKSQVHTAQVVDPVPPAQSRAQLVNIVSHSSL